MTKAAVFFGYALDFTHVLISLFGFIYYTRKNIAICQYMCSQCLFAVVDKSGTSCYHLVIKLIRSKDSQSSSSPWPLASFLGPGTHGTGSARELAVVSKAHALQFSTPSVTIFTVQYYEEAKYLC
jgi:hypothetical protein